MTVKKDKSQECATVEAPAETHVETQLAVPNDTATAAALKNFHMFFRGGLEHSLNIQGDDENLWAIIDGEEYPLVDTLFQAKIVQPGHVQHDAKYKTVKGKIIVVLDDDNPELEVHEELNLIPLAVIRQGMRHYGEYDSNNSDSSTLICYSSDGFYPAEKVVAPQHHICAEAVLDNGKPYRKVVCPCAEWVDGKKPACGDSITVAFFDLDLKVPVQMELHGGAISAWKKLAKAYTQAKQVAKLRRKSIYDFYVNLSVEDEGTYMRPVFKLVESTEESPFGKTTKWRDMALYYLNTLCPEPQIRAPGYESSQGPAQISVESEAKEAREAVVDAQAFDLN